MRFSILMLLMLLSVPGGLALIKKLTPTVPNLYPTSRFIKEFGGHVFNVELPSHNVIGVTAAHICNEIDKAMFKYEVLPDSDVCIFDSPFVHVTPVTIVKPKANEQIHIWTYQYDDYGMILLGQLALLSVQALEYNNLISAFIPVLPGDSGSPIMIDDNNAIGLLTAGFFTARGVPSLQAYITPLYDILNQYDKDHFHD